MKILLDACVLFPTVMREVLLGAAGKGAFQPLWSERILEEWARATRRLPPGSEAVARSEIALMKAKWPGAMVAPDAVLEARLSLPDPDDAHVLAAAITGKAEALMTLNARDFPGRTLAIHGLYRRDPDGFLVEFANEHPAAMLATVRAVASRAEAVSGRPQPLRPLLKRAGMPRLGKLMQVC